MITDFLETNFEKVKTDFSEMKPKDRMKVYCNLLQYGLPRLQSVFTELTGIDGKDLFEPAKRLTDEQFDELIKTINDVNKKN